MMNTSEMVISVIDNVPPLVGICCALALALQVGVKGWPIKLSGTLDSRLSAPKAHKIILPDLVMLSCSGEIFFHSDKSH
ncbi:hypothetical protein ASPBRDRAFT_452557 [Aspergillus brasiliensis CBS 101740]|uniref:Uncharacterized protein n=1 Tax=Aspergillus brasiliensis (strain CBS 101740 / IMI 381727 / IBT 21946) TaxID=767769 RepID=A0A1L9US29_ASPBC|nr:hypothetical protein ASPBRDRAFT_452557 [Aspergillus brasiliensis CBS 101740]